MSYLYRPLANKRSTDETRRRSLIELARVTLDSSVHCAHRSRDSRKRLTGPVDPSAFTRQRDARRRRDVKTKGTSPMTQEPLDAEDLVPQHIVRKLIDSFLDSKRRRRES